MDQSEQMNWVKQSEEVVFDSYRKIINRQFELPDQRKVPYEVFDGPDYVVVAAFTQEGRAIMNKQFRAGPEKPLWSFPSGMIDEGEQAVEAAKRELWEETGYEAGEIEHLKTIHTNYGTFSQHVFMATNCRPTGQKRLDSTEFIENELWERSELQKIAHDPQNTQLVHLEAVFLALAKMG